MNKTKKYSIALLCCMILLTACGRNAETLILGETGVFESADAVCETEPESVGSYQPETMNESSLDKILIYVCGAVNVPGVYELTSDARLYQAIEMAGGFTEDAAPDYINQAERMHDSQQIRVPTIEDIENGSYFEAPAAAEGPDEPGVEAEKADNNTVNINTASAEQLMTLPGIGQAKADAVILYREEHGRFNSLEEIMSVEGIKDGVFNKIKDKITL